MFHHLKNISNKNQIVQDWSTREKHLILKLTMQETDQKLFGSDKLKNSPDKLKIEDHKSLESSNE